VLYAKVVLGLPVEGPFDYIVPAQLEKSVSAGSRVWVNFRNKKEVGYVAGLSDRSRIGNLKEISSLIDEQPVLDGKMMSLAARLSGYYCCSLGEAVECILPEALRKGKDAGMRNFNGDSDNRAAADAAAVGRLSFVRGRERMPVYLREIRGAWNAGRSAIALFSDIRQAREAGDLIGKELGIEAFTVFRKQPKELDVWKAIRQQRNCVVVGTRSAVFAPVNNLGLIIIDQEQDQVYKQEQSPHYHASYAALARAAICGAKAVFGGCVPSLETFSLISEKKASQEVVPSSAAYPLVQVIDSRRLPYAQRKSKAIFSKFLEDAIYAALSAKEKVLVFIERRGFATSAACHNCGVAMKCPRCNINLVFHYGENRLKCHHCNFSMEVPEVCPNCRSGYIKYSGIGTEQLVSELSGIFPQARAGIIGEDEPDLSGADIFVSTSSVIKHAGLSFGLTGVIGIDNSLNRVDFRASEKTFGLLYSLAAMTRERMIIQSANIGHHCLRAVIKNEPQIFLEEELKQRKQLNFPPYRHMILLKLRGRDQEKVKKASCDLFTRLSAIKTSSIKMLSLNPGQPAKLRGNFYYQILMRACSPEKAGRFLKLHLKEGRFSGIIVSVDVDPV